MIDMFSYFLIVLAFAEGVIAALLLHMIRRHKDDQKTYLSAQKETYKTLEKLVTQTTKESQTILQQALNTQKSLVETIEIFERSLEKQMLQTLRTFGSKLEQTGDEQLKKTATELEVIVSTQNKRLTIETSKQIDELSTQTKSMVEDYRKMLLAQAITDQKATQEKLQTLVHDEKERLSQRAETIIASVSKQYFDENIDSETKHSIVMKLIEKELQ